jgi:hypothetical protein
MSIYRLDSENANPRATMPRVLSPHRRARLRSDSPHREFRDEFVEPSNLDIAVGLVGGASRTLSSLIEGKGDR